MKKICHGCLAMHRIEGIGCKCILEFKVESNKYKPLEECPKPRTRKELRKEYKR